MSKTADELNSEVEAVGSVALTLMLGERQMAAALVVCTAGALASHAGVPREMFLEQCAKAWDVYDAINTFAVKVNMSVKEMPEG